MPTLKQIIDTTPELTALGQDYAAIAAWLNERPLVANDAPQATVPHPPTLKEIFGVITVQEAAAIYNKPGLTADIRAAIDGGDVEYQQMMFAIVNEIGILSPASAQAIAALLQRTQPDPAWQAQVPGAPRWQTAGLAKAPNASDVQLAMNGG